MPDRPGANKMFRRGINIYETQKTAERKRIETTLHELTRLVAGQIIYQYQDAGLELPDEKQLFEEARNEIIERIVNKKIKDRFR